MPFHEKLDFVYFSRFSKITFFCVCKKRTKSFKRWDADPDLDYGTTSSIRISCLSNRDGNYVFLLGRRHEYTKEECAKQRDVVYANYNPDV